MEFWLAGTVFGLALLISAGLAWYAPKRWPQIWRTVPRERVIGGAIGLICLIWSANLVQPMLEGGMARYSGMVIPAAIAVGLFGAWAIDYVFARALGGLVLLVVNWMMHAAFVAHAPARGLFAVCCYVLGIVGILMIASPYRFRDLLEALTKKPSWRHATGAALALVGLVIGGISIASHG